MMSRIYDLNYHFCHMNFRVTVPGEESGISIVQQEPYADFRRICLDVGSDSNDAVSCGTVSCDTEIEYVKQVPIPAGEAVYQNVQGLSVYQEGDREYRLLRNYYTGRPRILLRDFGDSRTIQIAESAGSSPGMFSELELINALAWEKGMYEQGRFLLHSSFIETDLGAVLFTAPSGTGKSTQADLWNLHRGCAVINGDRAGIWKDGDTWMAGGVPWCGTSGIMKNRTMKLGAIVILRQGPTNEIIPLHYMYRAARILEQLTINPWNAQMLQQAQAFSMRLCREIPVLCLSCRPDSGAVEVLEAELENVI